MKNNKNDLYKDSKNIEENKEIKIYEKNTNNIEENIEEKNLDNTEGLKNIKNPNFEDNLSLNDTSLHGEKNDLTAIKTQKTQLTTTITQANPQNKGQKIELNIFK